MRVVVARSFEQEVMQTDKDVLLEFYAPWCGHCKSLEPVYKKLAKHLAKSNPDVVVAKMDATANDVHPGFKVEGFPTIFFVKAGEKSNPIPFSGDRSLKSLKVRHRNDCRKLYVGGTMCMRFMVVFLIVLQL